MFAKTIIDSDAFLDMPVTARLLYYDLSMRADDDGFVNSPKKIMRMIGASQDDINILIFRKFIIPFDNGIVVIKHWRIHNYIRKDTYNETPYIEQKAMLELDENKSYRLINQEQFEARQLSVDDSSTQVRLGKNRLGKNSIDNNKKKETSSSKEDSVSKENVDYEEVKNLFNSICKSYPKIRSITDKRKKHIKTRLSKYTLDDFKEAFNKMENSEFMKGNVTNWRASFDWIIESENNLMKTLEGNYDNNNKSETKSNAQYCQPIPQEDDALKEIFGIKE